MPSPRQNHSIGHPPIPADSGIVRTDSPKTAGLRIPTRSVLCIGTFDGVHRGHQAILGRGRKLADLYRLPLWAVTFDPHPKTIVRPNDRPDLLTIPDERIALLGAAGADGVLMMHFDAELARTPAADFTNQILRDALKAKSIIVGADFGFGQGRQGSAESLQAWGQDTRIEVEVISILKSEGDGQSISSSHIRNLMSDNHFNQAVQFMGHPYPVTGRRVDGDRRGREIGYPTWNLAVPDTKLAPPVGIYAAWTAKSVARPAMAYFGTNPTFGGYPHRLEVNVLEGSVEDCTPREPYESVWLTEYIRSEVKFDDVGDLIRQLEDDALEARRRLLGVTENDSNQMENRPLSGSEGRLKSSAARNG